MDIFDIFDMGRDLLNTVKLSRELESYGKMLSTKLKKRKSLREGGKAGRPAARRES